MKLVPLAKVLPHEECEINHLTSIKEQLLATRTLFNVPVALPAKRDEEYILLDGTHRVAAMRELGYSFVPLQIAKDEGVKIGTWSHVVSGREWLRELARGTDTAIVSDVRDIRGVFVKIQTPADVTFLVGKEHHAVRSDTQKKMSLFRRVSLTYTTYKRADAPILTAHEDASMVSFVPGYSLSDVREIATFRIRLPPGITRVLYGGRVLNLNVPLDFCFRLPDSTAWTDFLEQRMQNARFSAEEVFNCE
ncbi:hypothetical protein [Sulfobacillus thermosulfidooxidans]|uniref:hypothetical protein n=1 Tax=Sulfobacillus thermosulfidooxidans TaxID=28034 RepID=UPI0011122330|nr:hypothetical protein [Sulfobacillus thermosulfidooxidans]